MSTISTTKIVLQLAMDIAFPILDEIDKDGFQPSDLFAFMSSEQFKKDLSEAIKVVFNKTPTV